MGVAAATADEPNLRGRLVGWGVLVAAVTTLGYAQNYGVHQSRAQTQRALFQYSTAAAGVVVYAVLLGLVLLIARHRHDLLTLRRPRSWPQALLLAVGVGLAAGVVIQIVDLFLHGGREQGIVPDHWLPGHAGQYAANWVVVAGVAPFVEEVTYRGVGYTLVATLRGTRTAMVVTSLCFAASHGFLQAFPELAIFGFALAFVRSRTGSVYPGMLVHCAFNSFSLAQVFL